MKKPRWLIIFRLGVAGILAFCLWYDYHLGAALAFCVLVWVNFTINK